MSTMLDFLSGPAWQHLAVALLHTLWQGLGVAVFLWYLLRHIPANRPETRYWTAITALVAIVFSGLVTWSVLDYDWPKDRVLTGKQVVASQDVSRQSLETREQVIQETREAASLETSEQAASRSVDIRDGIAIENDSQHGIITRENMLRLIITAWLAGVVLMMGRMVWVVARVRTFVRGPEVVDERIRSLISELGRKFGLTRRLRIVESAGGFGPAVLGIVQPILAVPVSIMSGLPPDTVRAILAHELAHIRRHDYLLNMVQMVIEAVLFFNPAVWWINRQIRVEREACCDALAANIVGQPLVLAEALTIWAERVFSRGDHAAAMAWSNGSRPKLLLDRIRRMLSPGYRPQLPVSPIGFLGLLLAGILVLAGLWRGTSAAVDLAAKILTPAERIDKIVKTQQAYVPADSSSDQQKGKVTLKGTIRTIDGKPVPERILGETVTINANNSSGISARDFSPQFSVEVPPGKTWMCVKLYGYKLVNKNGKDMWINQEQTGMDVDGYAPAIVGPYKGKAGETISGIDIVCGHGFPMQISVKDENGDPVEGAEVSRYPLMSESACAIRDSKVKADAKGIAIMHNAIENLYSFYVQRPGFQPLSGQQVFVKRDQPITLTIIHAQPAKGMVLSPEGHPVADAKIREYGYTLPTGGVMHGQTGSVLDTTDADGHFELTELKDEATYILVAESDEYGRLPFKVESPAKKEITLKYGPVMSVTGKIVGDVGKLKQQNGKPIITYCQQMPYTERENWDYNALTEDLAVVAKSGESIFTIRGLLPGPVLIKAGEHWLETKVSPSEPNKEVIIDLTKPQERSLKRQVIVRFKTPDGGYPMGSIYHSGRTIPIANGECHTEVQTPTSIYLQYDGMIGYWFKEQRINIDAGEKPFETEIEVIPAGGIAGQVFTADGTAAEENLSIMGHYIYRTPANSESGSFANFKTVEAGKFFITPLRFGPTFTLSASRKHTTGLSKPIILSAEKPTASITITLPRITKAEGKIVDPARRPLPLFEFGLVYYNADGEAWNSWAEKTDRDGHFFFDDLNADLGGYELALNPRRDFKPLRVSLPKDETPITVQMQPGETLEGQVVDDKSGWPIPGVDIYACPSNYQTGDFACESEKLTDEQGKFKFSNLEDRSYQLNDRTGLNWILPVDRVVSPGKTKLIIRATLPEWSKLKPRQQSDEK